MPYSFEFSKGGTIYYQSGFESREEAKSRLEEFAKSHCRCGNSVGKLFRAKLVSGTFEFDLSENYRITVENGKVVLEELKN